MKNKLYDFHEFIVEEDAERGLLKGNSRNIEDMIEEESKSFTTTETEIEM